MNRLFKLSLILNGFPINRASKEFVKIQNANDKINPMLIFEYHKRHNEFYQGFIKDKGLILEWQDVPIISKSDFQRPLSDLIGSKKVLNLHIHNTSGSSGTPFFFAKDKFCHAMNWANFDNCLKQHGIEIGRSLQARFYGIPLGGAKYYKERFKDFLAGRIRFPVFDLSDKNLEKILHSFRTTKFEYINGYTSSLVVFAKFLIRKELCLKRICPTLKVVFPTSEVLDDLDRKTLERAFGVNVANEYGAAELDIIAFEDVDGDFVINNKTLFVEVLGEDNLPVASGVEGRVVVTSLYNTGMPFIRYDLGDRAVLSEKTKNGQVVLEKLIGRTNDIIKLPSGKVSPGLTFYYISKKILESGTSLKEFIVKQTQLGRFELIYVADIELSDEAKSAIVSSMAEYLESGLSCDFIKVEQIGRTKAGKLKHFVSELK
jgi:phenylacetate-CoA ligase